MRRVFPILQHLNSFLFLKGFLTASFLKDFQDFSYCFAMKIELNFYLLSMYEPLLC